MPEVGKSEWCPGLLALCLQSFMPWVRLVAQMCACAALCSCHSVLESLLLQPQLMTHCCSPCYMGSALIAISTRYIYMNMYRFALRASARSEADRQHRTRAADSQASHD